MLFSSLIFLFFFLPTVLVVYYLVLRTNRPAQNIFLLFASLFFYAWGEPEFVVVMLVSIFVNWLLALRISSCQSQPSKARAYLAVAVATNIAIIFVAKYLVFTIEQVNLLAGASFTVPDIALPIGISFFTFQALSYVIDVYRGEPVQKKLANVAFYIAFFPQLVAGPIVRYTVFADQIYQRKETLEGFASGAQRFVVGLGKKVLLANSCGLIADYAFEGVAGASVAMLWLGLVAYTLQIYYDFSGYSDMAIGLGKMFGFNFPENFNYPYVSKSISEFWRRWHISLGSWFRDYVYFPLGGSRVDGRGRLAFNLLAVWSLTGIWHGADWTFLIWGLLYFVLIAGEKIFPRWRAFLDNSKCLGHFYTMFFVMMGWVVFRSDNLPEALLYYSGMFGLAGNSLVDGFTIVLLKENFVILILSIMFAAPIAKIVSLRLADAPSLGWLTIVFTAALFLLSVSFIVKGFYNPFIYFNF